MRWKTNWPWHKICCHGSKQPAHTTSLRRELYQSILPPWPGLSRNGTPGRPLTLFGACADYLLLIFRDLHGGHSPAVSPRTVDHAACPLRYDVLFAYLPTSATAWCIVDWSPISGALTPRLAHLVLVLAAMKVWNDTLYRTEGRRKKWKKTKRRNSWMEESKKNSWQTQGGKKEWKRQGLNCGIRRDPGETGQCPQLL